MDRKKYGVFTLTLLAALALGLSMVLTGCGPGKYCYEQIPVNQVNQYEGYNVPDAPPRSPVVYGADRR